MRLAIACFQKGQTWFIFYFSKAWSTLQSLFTFPISKAAKSQQVKQEVSCTVIPSPVPKWVFPVQTLIPTRHCGRQILQLTVSTQWKEFFYLFAAMQLNTAESALPWMILKLLFFLRRSLFGGISFKDLTAGIKSPTVSCVVNLH